MRRKIRLFLPLPLRAQALAEAEAAAPAEACGLIVGACVGGLWRAEALVQSANDAPLGQFAIDPALQFRLQRHLREAGAKPRAFPGEVESGSPSGNATIQRDRAVHRFTDSMNRSKVIGCYHSHPGGDLTPSLRDRQDAGPDGFLWLIAGLDGALAAYRAPDFETVEVV